jgi:hypothetical protein
LGRSPDIDPDVDGVGAGKLAVVEDTEVLNDIRERRDRPLGSGLIRERLGGGGVRITRPPDGLTSPGGCLISMTRIGVTALLFTAIVLIALVLYWNGDGSLLACILAFVCIGVGVLWCAFALVATLVMPTARFVLTATPDHLTFETHDALRGTSCRTWKKQDIAWIRAETTLEPAGDSSPVVRTRVLIRTTSPIQPEPEELSGRSGSEVSKPEIEWIATTLRAVLGVPGTDAPTGNAIQAGSDEPRDRHRSL